MYTKKIVLFLLVSLVSLFSGCAHGPQQIWLAPSINVPPSGEGRGVPVALSVVDRRPFRSLGQSGAAKDPATELTTSQDIAAVVRQEIMKGLQAKGFVPVHGTVDEEVRLIVEVRSLEYTRAQGELTDKVNIQGILKAGAAKTRQQLEKTYRVVNTEQVLIAPSAETNARWINEALNDVLRQLLEDKELAAFMAD